MTEDPRPPTAEATDRPDAESSEEHGQRATWLELFFDLVVVVAMAQLVHHLRAEPTWVGLAEFALLYTAVWMSWTSFMLYANVAAERTRRRTMLVAMAGIAVMAATIPDATADSATAFAVAYIVVRFLASGSWQRTQTALLDWTAAQTGGGVVLWVVAFWFDPPTQQYLWAAGLAVDLVGSILTGRDPESRLERVNLQHRRQWEHRAAGRATRLSRDPGGSQFLPPAPPTIRLARLNVGHLGERLGLFVIIVLGEAVAQVVMAVSDLTWSRAHAVAAAAGFGLLVGLWWLTFQYGFAAAPYVRLVGLPPRLNLPIHLLTTAAIGVLAAGLGGVVVAPDETVPDGIRWLLCGGLAAYFLITAVGGIAARAPVHWILLWALPTVLGPIVLAAFGKGLAGWVCTMILVVMVLWQTGYDWTHQHVREWRDRRHDSHEGRDGRDSVRSR